MGSSVRVEIRVDERATQLLGATLPIGALLPGRPLTHSPPAPAELERAIEAVEDAVMPLAPRVPPGAVLATADALAHRLAALRPPAGAAPDAMHIDEVESLFNTMAAVAMGRPAAGSPFLDSALCGYLLILREVMHHLRFERVQLFTPAPPH